MKIDNAINKLLIRDMKRIDGVVEFEGIDSKYEFKAYKICFQAKEIIRIDLKEIWKRIII